MCLPIISHRCVVWLLIGAALFTGSMRIAAQVDDAIDNPGLVFTGGGIGAWSPDNAITHDGVDSARSASITHNQTSSMNVTVNGPAVLVFWWKASSEGGFDLLRLIVDGIQVAAISGETNWTPVTQALGNGSHTVEWRYTKDGSITQGSDCGWVDQLAIVPSGADDDLHVNGRIASLSIGRTLITGVPAKNRFKANALVKLQRLDEAALPAAAADLPLRINWSLSDLDPGSPGVVEAGAHDFTVPLATHGDGATPTPATDVRQEVFDVGVDELTQIFPTHSYRLTWSATYTNWDGGQVSIGSGQIDNFRLMKFSGLVHAGGVNARFDEIGFAPNTVIPDATGYVVTVDMPADHAWLADNTSAKFRINNVDVHYDPVTLDISIIAGQAVVLSDFSSNSQGVSMTLSGVHLSATGLEADLVKVKLPAGFGFATSATSRVLNGEINFANQALDGSGVPVTSSLTYSPGGSLYLVHEKLPVRYATSSLTYNIGTSVFSASSATPAYVRKRERDWLAQDATRGALTDSSAATKASNESPYALAENAGSVAVSVRADNSGVALLTTIVPLATPTPETFVMHFPRTTALSVTGGFIQISDSVFTSGQLTLDAPVLVSYTRNPLIAPECGLSFFDPDNASLPVSITNNVLNLTADGGWRAAGTVPSGNAVQWGGLHVNRPTHELTGLSDVSLMISGNVFSADPSDPEITLRPAKMLLSGIGKPADATYTERPDSAAYLTGLADYAGLNVRNSGNALVGRSFLGEQDTGNYPLKSLAKFYLRPGGVTGVHDAVTAQVPMLHFYGYLTQLDGLRLSFRDSNNIESATGGSMTLPFPSDFSVDFKELTFKSSGALDKADLPDNTPEKSLSYWGCSLKPDSLDFTPSKSCLTHASYLTLSGEIGLGYISNDKVRGTLAFAPDGKLIPPSANLALDTSIPTPVRMSIQGRGDLSYPFTPSTRLRFNNYNSNPGGPGDGFLFVAGSMDVPFFENLRVLLHLHPSKLDSACDVIGGWPSDPSQADRGWTVDKKNYFNFAKFDPNDNGYDANVPLADFRKGFDDLGGVTNKFRPHVHKDWRKIVDFEFPMHWDAQTRQFLPAGDKSIKLLVLTAKGQVKKLDAAGAEMTFGAEFAALPKINIQTFTRIFGDAGAHLIGSPEKKIATALTTALQGAVDQALIQRGNKALDEVLADSITDLMRGPVEQATDDILNNNTFFEDRLFNPMAVAYAANNQTGNGLTFAKAALLGQKMTFSYALRHDLGASVSAAMQDVDSLGGRLEKADAALAQLEILCNPDQNSGTLIHALARRVAQQFLGQDFLGSSDPGVGGPLNELVDGLLEDARPALREIYQAIGKQRTQLNQIRNSLAGGNSGLGRQIRNAFTENAVNDIADRAIEDLAAEIGNSRDANGKFYDNSENGPAKLQARLRAHVIDRFHASLVSQSIKRALRQFVAPVRDVENQALNLAFAEVNHMVNEVALKIVNDPTIAIGNNSALISLRDTVGASFDKEQDALGDFRKKYNDITSVFQFAKVQGYARTRGDTLDELRVDASIGLSIPDPFGFQGFVLIKNFQSDVPSTSCRPPGVVATEVTIGSTFGGTLAQPVPASDGGARQPDRKQAFRAQIEGRFSFGPGAIGPDFPIPIPNGFDAKVDFQTQMDLGVLSVDHLQLAVGLGGNEAYASAAASGSIWFIQAQGRVFMGSTHQRSILREAFDDQTYKLVVTDGSLPGDAHCLLYPVVGLYTRFSGQVSLNRIFGIPDNPCLISLNAGREFGHFALFSTGNSGLQLNVGYREALTITGKALCIFGVDAKAGYLVALNILPNSLTTSLTEAMNSVKGRGVAFVNACVDVLGIRKCFHGTFTIDIRPNPAFAPPILVIPVGFEY